MSEKNKPTQEQKKLIKEAVVLLVSLVLVSAAVCATYRFLLGKLYFELVLYSYLAIETLAIVAYVVYNRGFSRKGVTYDMLPIEWSDEKKKEFIEDGKRRLRKSRWLLVIIVAFLFTFALDVIELVVFPFIFDLIGI